MMNVLVLLSFLSFSFPSLGTGPVPEANPITMGEKAFEEKKYEEAYTQWRGHADKTSHPLSQFRVGMMLAEGRGTKANPVEALTYIEKAANQKFLPALSFLGESYDSGNGVKKDPKIAFSWFEKAAMAGHAASQHKIGSMYHLGQGTSKDDKKAYKWIYIAAKQLEGKVKEVAEQNLSKISASMSKEDIESIRKEADAFKAPAPAKPKA